MYIENDIAPSTDATQLHQHSDKVRMMVYSAH